jgi:hypothetical protein
LPGKQIEFMEFHERIQKAIERGQRLGDEKARAEAERALSEEECKRLHTQYRLKLSEHIEKCLAELPRNFPGFHLETLYGDRGWGAAAVRNDLIVEAGKRMEYFSRLEMTVRPFSHLHVLELTAKGTIQNKELFNRTHFQRLSEVDIDAFETRVDNWTLEFAELYASKQ